MSWKQTSIDKSTIFGAGSISRVILPYIISGIRRNDPDMISVSAYYPSLSGKTVIIEQGGTFSGTTTITFTSDIYATAITDINTAAPTHIKAGDYEGYLGFISQHAGGSNYLKITGGTALSILGIDADPHPAAISYAGEIDSPKPSTYESRTKGTGVILKNEGVNRENWNRGLAAVGYVLDSFQANLDREIVFPVQYSTTINGSSFSIVSDDRFYISGNGIVTPNPSTDTLDKLISVLDTNNNQLFDNNGDRVRVTSITYGTLVDATSSFSSWTTSDGKSVFGNSAHIQKVKTTQVITSINGNTIKCTGATFITNKVQVNDTLKVTGATNSSPFSHNGEFYVDEVISETLLKVRPKGTSDGALTTLANLPTCLNQIKGVGEIYGSVIVYMGSFVPLSLPAANMVFNLSATLPSATYKVVLPIGKSLKNLLQEDITASTIVNPFGGQLELGSKLIATLANALKPRIISKPNGDTTKTLFAEFKNGTIGTRIYTVLAGGIEVVYNGKWDGAVYVKDDGTKDVVIMKEDLASVFLGTTNINLTMDWVNMTISMGTTNNQFTVADSSGILKAKVATNFAVNDGSVDVLVVPKYDGTSASNSTAKSGLILGTGYTTDNQHLIEKINFSCNTSSTKYTLLSETTLTNARKREYVIGNGTSVTTINAEWDGTQWVKDYSGPSSKVVLVLDDIKLYTNSNTTTPFSDTAWLNKEEIKTFQLHEDFLTPMDPVLDSVNDKIGKYFEIKATTNTATYSTAAANAMGEITVQSSLTGAYDIRTESVALNVGTGDFEMRCRINVQLASTLSGIDIGITNGLIIGNNTGGADNLTFKCSGSAVWNYQIGTNLINTGVSVFGYTTLVINRTNGTVNCYINDILHDTRAFAGSLTFIPAYHIDGIAVSGAQDIFSLDFFKFWMPGYYK